MLRYVVHPSTLVTVVRVGRVQGTVLEAQMEVGKVQSRYRGHRKSRVCVDEWPGPHASGLGVSAMDARALPSDQISLSAGVQFFADGFLRTRARTAKRTTAEPGGKSWWRFRKLMGMG